MGNITNNACKDMKRSHRLATAIRCASGLLALSVMASATVVAAKDLTAFGSIMEGNEEGTIPAYTGGLKPSQIPANFSGSGAHHPDPFPNDKAQFIITSANYKDHKDKLSTGTIAMFETYPDSFSIPVYQTRRTHSLPDWVTSNTLKNAETAKLVSGGNGIVDAFGGIPFPMADNALEVIWNHMFRWRGRHLSFDSAETAVQSNGRYVLISGNTEVDFAFYKKGGSFDTLENLNFYFLRQVNSPARLAGNATLVHEKLNQTLEPRQAWIYTAGLRRVRRAPNLAFDAPISSSEGLRTADQTDMYNGSPERYSWKLVEKKEMYIPYNSYRISSPDVTYDQVLLPGHVNPDLTRWELHRVWVVEAVLKEGERHIYGKRTFYIDEDSWGIALGDMYDGRGELWRVSMAHMKNFYDLPGTITTLDTFYDLQSKRYHVMGLANELPKSFQFAEDSPGSGKFQPAALRRLGRR